MLATKDYPVGKGGVKGRYIGGTLVFDAAIRYPETVHEVRSRVAIAGVNAGSTLLAAIPGWKYRMVDCQITSIGGAAADVTTVDILATLSGSGRKLVAFAQANLTEGTLLRAGGTGAAVLADGASFTDNDVNTAITIGKTGSDVATATHFDVVLRFALVKA